MFTPQVVEATLRAVVGAFVLTAVQFFAMLPQTEDWRLIASVAGGTFFGFLAIRGGWEGIVDSRRAVAGNIRPADVGYQVAAAVADPNRHVDVNVAPDKFEIPAERGPDLVVEEKGEARVE